MAETKQPARTYTLEKRHPQGRPTLYQVTVHPGGAVTARNRFTWTPAAWGTEYPLTREMAADCLLDWRRRARAAGNFRLTRTTE